MTTAVLPIQRVVATAYPTAWRDGIVTSVDDGLVVLAMLAGEIVALATLADITVGEPVAFHPVAEVLTVDGGLLSARAV